MSKIEEQDILKLLRGEASPKKLKKLEAWASEDVDNATDLELYQTIYDESEHLSSYVPVDADAAWNSFSKALHNSVEDTELLHYFDGLASPAEKKKVEEWRGFSSSNTEEFNAFNAIISESSKLTDYKTVDIAAEWNAFDNMIKGKANPPNLTAVSAAPVAASIIDSKPSTSTQTTYTPTPTSAPITTGAKEVTMEPVAQVTEERSGVRSLWPLLAVAASLFFVSIVGYNMYQNGSLFGWGGDENYATFATADAPDNITISDGSFVGLDSESSITYFKDVNSTDTRDVELDGRGEFDIASIPEKPFVLTTKKSGIGVRVLGTKFRIEGGQNEFIEIVENIEGSVRAYSLEDTATYVIMTAGDRYGWDGHQFINLNDLEEDYNGQDYDILYVLDHLMKESDWRVISGSEIEFDPQGIVNVDLDKSYEEVLEDLAQRAGFDFVERDCDGCYEVRRFVVE